MAGALAPGLVRLGEQRRRAGDEQAHVRCRLAVQAVLLQQAHIEGRHAHQRGGARQRGDDRAGSNFGWKIIAAPAMQDDIGGDEQAVRVEDRQRVDQHVVAGEAPVLDQRPALEARFSWVSMAPLERPVVPDV